MPLFRFHVIVTPSDEVVALRREIDELKQDVQRLKEESRQAAFRYGCEVTINNRILDWCSENNVKVPRELLVHPNWGD